MKFKLVFHTDPENNIFLIYISAITGAIFCIVSLTFARNRKIRTIIRRLSLLILIATWANCLWGIMHWHLYTEPTLDGSEGAGAGFGYQFIHFITPVIAVLVTLLSLPTIYSDHEK